MASERVAAAGPWVELDGPAHLAGVRVFDIVAMLLRVAKRGADEGKLLLRRQRGDLIDQPGRRAEPVGDAARGCCWKMMIPGDEPQVVILRDAEERGEVGQAHAVVEPVALQRLVRLEGQVSVGVVRVGCSTGGGNGRLRPGDRIKRIIARKTEGLQNLIMHDRPVGGGVRPFVRVAVATLCCGDELKVFLRETDKRGI